jgi:hypothetical protein
VCSSDLIFVENRQPLFEAVQLAGKREYSTLLSRMRRNPALTQTLTTPIGKLPKYRFLFDYTPGPIQIGRASLLNIIEYTMKQSDFESYLIKTSKGLYAGFIAVHIEPEDDTPVIDDIKTFSFGLEGSDDENQMYKDLPAFLDKCLAKYKKVSWTALEGNKANRAYAIYTKRRKGTVSKDGKYIRYTCGE